MLSKNMKKVLCIALILLILGSFGACLLQTGGFTVRVADIFLPTDHQQYLHGTMYIPKSASAENPVPVIVAAHGWGDSNEKLDCVGIEMSRRGVAVITMDGYSHGLSSNTDDIIIAQAGMDGLGMRAMIQYLTSGILDYIDTGRIGIFGHSMGASIIGGTLFGYGEAYNAVYDQITAADSEDGAAISSTEQAALDASYPVHSAFVMGNMDETVTMAFDTLHCNLAVEIGSHEELTVDEYATWQASEKKDGFFGFSYALKLLRTIQPDATDVSPNVYYGNKADKTMRVYYEEFATHPSTIFLPAPISKIIDFFTESFDINTSLPEMNQVFLPKRFCNLAAMAGLLMLVFPLAAILIQAPSFEAIRGTEGSKQPALIGERKQWFLLGVLINTIAAIAIAFLTHRLYNASWYYTVFPAHLWIGTPYFSCNNLNCIVIWTILNVIWNILWFIVSVIKNKNSKEEVRDLLALNIDVKAFIKTVWLAFCTVGVVYAIVFTTKWLLGTDFRFYQAAIKVFKPSILWTCLIYFPFFLVGQLTGAVFVNGTMRYEGMSEAKSLIIAALVSVSGILVMTIVQYGGLIINGFVGLSGDWAPANTLGNCIWLFLVAPIFHRFFYRITGKNWLGPLTFALLFTVIGVANTCISSPWF